MVLYLTIPLLQELCGLKCGQRKYPPHLVLKFNVYLILDYMVLGVLVPCYEPIHKLKLFGDW